MDKKTKVIVVILNYLTKRFKSQKSDYETFHNTLIKLNFIKEAKNKRLFNFYNDNVEEGVNWESFDDLSYLSYGFIDKIIAIRNREKDPSDLFSNPIDDVFGNGFSSSGDYVEFNRYDFELKFRYGYSNIYLNLLGQDEYEMQNYWNAKYHGDCYRPDNSDEYGDYLFTFLNGENLKILQNIMFSLGKNRIAKHIENIIQIGRPLNQRDDGQILNEIVDTFDTVFGQSVIEEMFDDYSSEVNSASCESVEETFENNLPDGITVEDTTTITVTYDFFIEFLENHPEITTFGDLKKYKFVDSGANIEDALYSYDIDQESLNYSFNRILSNLEDKVESDESFSKSAEAIKEFEQMIKDLKFKFEKEYVLEIRNKENKLIYKFVIDPDDVNYGERKLDLLIVDYRPNGEANMHRIPFEELPKYVTMEKLFESILSKLR